MKYEQLGAGWQDKKYNELGVVVRDCNKALNDILVIMLQAEKYVALLAKSLSEYESVQLGSTNGISASTPQTSSFAVTLILSILVYTFFSRMFDLMLPPVAKHSIVVA